MEVLMQKNDLLTMLDRQAKDWLTPQNIDEKIETELNNLLPPIIASHKDYYNRLIRFSFNIEQGKFEEAEDVKINKKAVEHKNKLLSPLYQELKTIIKYLTITEENSSFELYRETINRIKSKFSIQNDPELRNLIEKISYDFKRLITLIRLENEKPENKINLIETQLKSLVMILVVWNKYTDIIYKPEEDIQREIEESSKLTEYTKQRLEAKSLDELIKENDLEKIKDYYLQRITEKKGKGKGLFINEFLGLYDNPQLRQKMDKLESDDMNKIDSVNYNDPKLTALYDEVQKESKKAENKKNVQNEKSSKRNIQADSLVDEFEIKKARNFEINEKAEEEEHEKDKNEKKASKKERFAVESSEAKIKKKKKAAITETKRKLLENEVSEVFQDQEETSEEASEVENLNADKEKNKLTEEEIEKNRKELEELFEKNNEDSNPNKNSDLNVNEKLKGYYDFIKSEKLGFSKDAKKTSNLKSSTEHENILDNETSEKIKEALEKKNVVAQLIELTHKQHIECI